MDCCNRHSVIKGETNHIGKVVLTLSVLIFQTTEPISKMSCREAHDAGIHFANAFFLGGSIFFLND